MRILQQFFQIHIQISRIRSDRLIRRPPAQSRVLKISQHLLPQVLAHALHLAAHRRLMNVKHIGNLLQRSLVQVISSQHKSFFRLATFQRTFHRLLEHAEFGRRLFRLHHRRRSVKFLQRLLPVTAAMMIHMPLRKSRPQPANQRAPPAVRLQRAAPLAVPRRQPKELSVKLIGKLASQRIVPGNRNRRSHQRLPVIRNKALPRTLIPGRARARKHQVAQLQPAEKLRLLLSGSARTFFQSVVLRIPHIQQNRIELSPLQSATCRIARVPQLFQQRAVNCAWPAANPLVRRAFHGLCRRNPHALKIREDPIPKPRPKIFCKIPSTLRSSFKGRPHLVRRRREMKILRRFLFAAAFVVLMLAAYQQVNRVKAAGGPSEASNGSYRVLAPIESGNLLLFPVVRASSKSSGETPFITLDEGIRAGDVEVTEAGNVRGLVRHRGPVFSSNPSRGDEVNTLVLVNHSSKPLLLLAGEIVTGGKQDRVIAKDRIVPVGADPIDLSVFCIEPGRWTESSPTFGAAAKAPSNGFMVQPTVRERAMVEKDQQQVWDSVHGAISSMAIAAAPPASAASHSGSYGDVASSRALGTTSYAKVMQSSAISEKVDEAAAPVMKSRDQVLAQLREQHAVGVVVAVRGEIVWADLFADTELLSRYWTKLVRSYAAESLTAGETHPAPSLAQAQHFLDAPAGGTETTEGDVGIYRYRELKSGTTETFVLESLLPGTGYDVHVSKMQLINSEHHIKPYPIVR